MSGPVIILPPPAPALAAGAGAGALLVAGGAVLAAYVVAELLHERQKRLEELAAAACKFNDAKSMAAARYSAIQKQFEEELAKMENEAELKITADMMNDIKQRHLAALKKIMEMELPSEVKEIKAMTVVIKNEIKSIYKDYSEEIVKPVENVKEYNEKLAGIKDQFNFSMDLKETIPYLDKDYDFTGTEQSVIEMIKAIMIEADGFVNNDFIKPKERKELMKIVETIQRMAKEKDKLTENAVRSINSQYLMMKSSIAGRIKTFEMLYNDYVTETLDYANVLGGVPVLPPKEKFADIEELTRELEELRELSRNAIYHKYVREQLDDVMTMFGYNVGQSLVMNSNQKGDHILCENEKDDSAIHLYMSQKNEIMIEIVGHGEYENAGDNEISNAKVVESKDLTDGERSELLEKQKTFCEIQKEMVKELEKRGILIGQVIDNEADEKYCKKILTKKQAGTRAKKKEKTTAERRPARGNKDKIKEMKVK